MRRLTVSLAAASLLLGGLCACSGSAVEPELFTADDLAKASDFQREILADGEVSWAEYEKAVIAERDCLLAAGYEPDPVKREGSQLGFTVTVNYENEADPDAADSDYLQTAKECREQYTEYVSMTWGESLVITDSDERERMLNALTSCLGDAEFDVPQDADVDDIVEQLKSLEGPPDDAVVSCVETYDRLFYVSILAK